MNVLLALVVGGLYGTGLFMMLRRSIIKFIIGLALISHAANLLVFTVAGLTRGEPPLIPTNATKLADDIGFSDPLPSALILTAIVISFSVVAFAMVLVHRVYQTVGSDDIDDMQSTDT